MNIPNLPKGKMIDSQGELNPSHRVFFNQLIRQLQIFLNDERYKTPQVDSSQESSLNIDDNESGLLYNTEQKAHKLNQGPILPAQTTSSFVTVGTYIGPFTTANLNTIPADQRNGKTAFDTTLNKAVLGANGIWHPLP